MVNVRCVLWGLCLFFISSVSPLVKCECFNVDYFYRMQNDMKLPAEQRRKWVCLDLKPDFTLQKMIMWFTWILSVSLTAINTLWTDSSGSGGKVKHISYSHEHLHVWMSLFLNTLFSQREQGSCSQEPLWHPAEEPWSLSDRWGSSAWWEWLQWDS